MTDFVASEPVWVVLTVIGQLVAVEPGQQFTSRQVCEVFTVEAAAVARAVACGWSPDYDDVSDEPDDLLPEAD